MDTRLSSWKSVQHHGGGGQKGGQTPIPQDRSAPGLGVGWARSAGPVRCRLAGWPGRVGELSGVAGCGDVTDAFWSPVVYRKK